MGWVKSSSAPESPFLKCYQPSTQTGVWQWVAIQNIPAHQIKLAGGQPSVAFSVVWVSKSITKSVMVNTRQTSAPTDCHMNRYGGGNQCWTTRCVLQSRWRFVVFGLTTTLSFKWRRHFSLQFFLSLPWDSIWLKFAFITCIRVMCVRSQKS